MNTNHEDTGVCVTLRKTGHTVHLGVEVAGRVEFLKIDDTKSVYTAMHEVKDGLAEMVKKLVESALSAQPFDPLTGLQLADGMPQFRLLSAGDAAAVLDGKQVATPVAQPVLEMPDFGDLDALHAEALAEDALRTADDDGDEPPTKTETPAGKRGRKPKAA